MKKYEIVRETPQYNKYIKWFYRSYHDDGSMICSLGFKTRREAQAFHDKQISTGGTNGNLKYCQGH